MRIFIQELKTRHRANFLALLRRHKASIGYVILAVGVITALLFSAHALRQTTYRDERTRAAICQNTINSDRQQIVNLITKSGHELLKDFHLQLPKAAILIHRQLVTSAQERRSLQPSNPASACSGKLTRIHIHPPPVDGIAKAVKVAEGE